MTPEQFRAEWERISAWARGFRLPASYYQQGEAQHAIARQTRERVQSVIPSLRQASEAAYAENQGLAESLLRTAQTVEQTNERVRVALADGSTLSARTATALEDLTRTAGDAVAAAPGALADTTKTIAFAALALGALYLVSKSR